MHKKTVLLLASLAFACSCLFGGIADAADTPDYSKVRIREFPVAMQCWTFHKFTFMETLDKVKTMGIKYLEAFPGQKLGEGFGETGFGPDMTKEQIGAVKKALSQRGITLVNFGVVDLGNNETSMRKIFDFAKTIGVRTIVTEPSFDDYSPIDKLVKEYNIKVAIHNHPEPNKYARPETVLTRIKGMDSRIGDCADTGHWLRTGVVPVEALRLLSGRITSVHLKDLNEFGKKDAYDVPFGSGKANVHDILAELTLQDYRGYLVIEHENQAELDNPEPSIMKGLKYVDSIVYYKGYNEILNWSPDGFNMHGWNHYGPGYFTLDNKTGVLESFGGMGLLWYSVKKYGNFVLELDYKCQSSSTNSGVFIRVPDMLSSDDYIYHSFEIQIDDSQKGVWRTGGVYDAEAPKMDAFNPAGQWNHYKIMFVGGKITIELNGKITADWNAEPRGKIKDFAKEGFIGLQNHDDNSHVYFKNIFIKSL